MFFSPLQTSEARAAFGSFQLCGKYVTVVNMESESAALDIETLKVSLRHTFNLSLRVEFGESEGRETTLT